MSDTATATTPTPKYLSHLLHHLLVLPITEAQFLSWLLCIVIQTLPVMSNKRSRKQKQEEKLQNQNQPPANPPSPTPSSSTAVSDVRPPGGRKNRSNDDGALTAPATQAVNSVPTGDLILPGVTPGQEENTSLKIKVHLNLHAKVRVDVDAQLYGDIIIGLL